MGYSAPKKVYRLVFEDPAMNGLVVRARAASLGKLMSLMSIASLAGKAPADMTGEDFAETDKLFRLFADCLVDWNLEDEGTPVPPTYDGLMEQEIDWVNALVEAWMTGTMGVSGPLVSSSTGGARFPEGSIPMEPLSASRAS